MRARRAPRPLGIAISLVLAVGLPGCGGGSVSDTVTRTAPLATATPPASPSGGDSATAGSTPSSAAATATPASATASVATVSVTATPSQPTQVPATVAPPTLAPTAPPTPAAPASATVNLDDQALQFAPARITIAAGGAVTWVWGGSQFHDVTGNGFASDTKNSGSFTHTFPTPGTYAIVCMVHESRGMRGTIVVQ